MKLPFVLSQAVKHGGSLQEIGMLLYHLASKIKDQICHFIPMVVEYIVGNKIDSQQQIDGEYSVLLSFSIYIFLPNSARRHGNIVCIATGYELGIREVGV
jgi:hypothetical protein